MLEKIRTCFKPCEIANLGVLFSIPLYQRLFAWSVDDIEQLLNDLYSSYKKNGNSNYYIGILTATYPKKTINLVDGQQRFTVLTLIALVLSKLEVENKEKWKNFAVPDGHTPILSFFARDNDKDYLEKLIKSDSFENMINLGESGYVNKNMERGIVCINHFFENSEYFSDKTEKDNFSKYIFEHLTFFISYLPQNYNNKDLNKYFESMNSRGKALENFDILKVKLLNVFNKGDSASENLNEEVFQKINYFTDIWNNVYNSFTLINKNDEANKSNLEKEILTDKSIIELISPENTVIEKPKPEKRTDSESLFQFPLFLLLVRYKQLKQENLLDKLVSDTTSFFKVTNLLESFAPIFDYNDGKDSKEKVETFFELLKKYNGYLEKYFIKRSSNELSNYPKFLKLQENENEDLEDYNMIETDENNSKYKKCLTQFQSMLYVSSSNATYYKWFIPAIEFIENKNENITAKLFLDELKSIDNNNHVGEWNKLSAVQDSYFLYSLMTYQTIDRYWFWRLDYYLWENGEMYFGGDNKLNVEQSKVIQLVNNFRFQRNRSIEHIAPQTPQTNAGDNAKNLVHLHNFGNLAMISSGQNSSLLNSSYEEKSGHILSFINGSKVGSIESLKMLYIYAHYGKWDDDSIINHEKEMIKIIDNSFKLKKR